MASFSRNPSKAKINSLILAGLLTLLQSCTSNPAAKNKEEFAFQEQVQKWFSKRTDLNRPQPQLLNHTPLCWAIGYGYADAVQTLLENGADPNTLDQEAPTSPPPLSALSSFVNRQDDNALRIARMLIEKGANVNAENALGMTPLSSLSSLRVPLRSDLMNLLVQNGANPNIPDNNGYTSLHWMTISNDPIAVQLLLKHGANLNAKCKAGQTPLHLAAIYGYPRIVKLLMDAGADANMQDDLAGKTALDWCQEAAQRNLSHEGSDFTATIRLLERASGRHS